MATFRRFHDGSWGVLVGLTETIGNDGEDDGLGRGRSPVPGSTVTVTKRDGTAQTVTLGELVSRDDRGWVFKIAPRTPAAPATQTQVGDLSGILALFERARQHLRFPAIVLSVPQASTIQVSMAGQNSRVPRSLNVTAFDEYFMGRRRWFGRVLQNGTFEQSRELLPDAARLITERLQQLATDPARVAAEHGRLTGRCCFCNRGLDDERSTAMGYGPVCARHYGLPWGERPAEFAAAPRGEGGEASYQQADARADAANHC